MKKSLSIIILLSSIGIGSLKGQDIPRYYHYFNYGYLYNPAFLGQVEATRLNMIYRKQWVGLDGAPEFIHAGLQVPLSQNIAIGLNASNFEQGLIIATSAMGSVAYTVNLGYNKTLSFGVSVGAGRTALDASQITDFSDPAIAGALDKSFYMEGQAGLSLNLNKLNLAITLPKLFEKSVISDKDFQDVSLGPLNSNFSSISYKFDLSPKFSFEPMGTYQMDSQLEDQWQAYATVYYGDLLWLGGSYSDGYGVAGNAGFQVNDFLKISYSFAFANNELSAYNSHEFYLSLKLGNKKVDRTRQYISKSTETVTPVVEDTEVVEEPIQQVDEIEERTDKIAESPIINTPEQQSVEKEAETQILEEEEATTEPVEEPTQAEPVATEIDGMAPGYYVVIGAFVYEANALNYIKQVESEGYQASQAYNTRTQYHYVYLLHTESKDEANEVRNNMKKLTILNFNEVWVLNIM